MPYLGCRENQRSVRFLINLFEVLAKHIEFPRSGSDQNVRRNNMTAEKFVVENIRPLRKLPVCPLEQAVSSRIEMNDFPRDFLCAELACLRKSPHDRDNLSDDFRILVKSVLCGAMKVRTIGVNYKQAVFDRATTG